MFKSEVKAKHLDSIASKIGYQSYDSYVKSIKEAFEECKTIKGTSEKTGHAQYTIRHLLINNFGKEWIESIRKEGLVEARTRQLAKIKNKPKKDQFGDKNYNAYVWEAISPTGEVYIIRGKRLKFCKDKGIGVSLDPYKPHLRNYWQFKKLCKVKDYNGLYSV